MLSYVKTEKMGKYLRSYTYNKKGKISTINTTAREGRYKFPDYYYKYKYNKKNQVTKEIAKEKRSDKVVLCTYKYKYNNKGQLTRVQGGLGRKLSTLKYDTNGNLTSIEGKGRIHSMKNIYDDKWLTF